MKGFFPYFLVLTSLFQLEQVLAADLPAKNAGRLSSFHEDEILARVNGVPIAYAEVRQTCHYELGNATKLSEPERSDMQTRIIHRELNRLIERELILHEARVRLKKEPGALAVLEAMAASSFEKQIQSYKDRVSAAGIPCETDEQFKELLKSQELTLDSLQRQSVRNFIAMEYMRRRIGPADPEVLERKYTRIVARLRKSATIEILWPDYDKSGPDAATSPPEGHWRVKIELSSPQPGSPPP